MNSSVTNAIALSTACFLLVVWQAIIIYKRRHAQKAVRSIELRQLYAGLARSPGCVVADRGQGIRIGVSSIHGNGVFASKKFSPGDLIETCPLVWIPNDGQVALTRFTFRDKRRDNGSTLVLGYGSIYNHSSLPNASFAFPTHTQGVMTIHAIKDIDVDDELLINYGPAYWKAMSRVDAVLSDSRSGSESAEKSKASSDDGCVVDTNVSTRSSEEA